MMNLTFKAPLLTLILLSFFPISALSQDSHLFDYQLSAPPAEGSAEYVQDFLKLHEYQDHRTPAQCEVADAQTSINLETGFGPETGVLTKKEVKAAKVLSLQVIAKAVAAASVFKQKFKRPRPYKTDLSLKPCIRLPGDLSYPSGHSTIGYALALALAKKFPAKKALILQQGFQIGENRVIGGVHHPSDVEAGRRLAEQL